MRKILTLVVSTLLPVFAIAQEADTTAAPTLLSLQNGCKPVEIPDFTRGAWDRVKGFSYAFAE